MENRRQAHYAPGGREKSSGGFLKLVLMLLCVGTILWSAVNIHPETGTAASATTAENTYAKDLMTGFDVSVNNLKSSALENIAYIKKVYTIPENDLVAPRPDQTKFGETTDPAVIQDVIDSAADLLDGQSLCWSPDVTFLEGAPIKYYCDDTILVICWKENINRSCVSFAEVKVAHGSQFRRAIAENTYGSSVQQYPSVMAKNVNAIVAMNGDFYSFRRYGLTVYQRHVYRCNTANMDTCFIDTNGDMSFCHIGELTDPAEAEQYVADHDILFSLSFGPILVEDGEPVYHDGYPIGEVNTTYSRSGLGQLGPCHYLLATLGEENEAPVRVPVNTFADYMHSKGCEKAYTLDGGQTATLVMNGSVYNRVDWNSERTMSDIIYFATAIDSGEAA